MESQIFAIFLVLLTTLSFLITAVKTSFVNARLEKVEADREWENVERDRALLLLQNRESVVFRLQASHVLLRFLMGAALVWLFSTAIRLTAGLFAMVVVYALILAAGEQVLERQVLKEPEKWLLRLAGVARGWLWLLWPLLVVPLAIYRLFSSGPQRFFRVTEEELNIILDAGQREGVIEVDEREMINSIFQFRDTLVREIMIPRIDLLSLSQESSILEAIDAMLQSGFSRVPVFEDTVDNVLGVLYIKDLLGLYRQGKTGEAVGNYLRPAYFVPETKRVGELLAEMQADRIHIAIVVDEYGGVAGIATLEDIVEEIVGEIQDEYDDAEEQLCTQVGEQEYIFLGKIDINEFNDIMGTDLSKSEAETLGGLIYSRFGGVPRAGEVITTDDILMTVEQVAGRRIRKVRVQRALPLDDPEIPSAHVEP